MSIEAIDLLRFALLVIFTEAVTEILVAAEITDGLRAFIFKRANPDFDRGIPDGEEPKPGPAFWRFVNDVFACGYCMSVWVAMGSALFAPWWLATGHWTGWLANWLLMVFVIHRTCNYLHVVFSLTKKGRVKTYDIELVHKHQVSDDGSIGQAGGSEGPSS
jgi:hypothetical protein